MLRVVKITTEYINSNLVKTTIILIAYIFITFIKTIPCRILFCMCFLIIFFILSREKINY
jgi:hypothetical protein